MADAAAFDTLATARKLKAAGFNDVQAEAQAEAIAQAARRSRDDLATKADLAALETRLTVRFYGALIAMGAVMVAAVAAFTRL